MTRTTKAAVAAITALIAAGAQAEDGPPIFKFSGFATAGMVHSSDKNADFVSSYWFQPNGAGATRAWSSSVDSRVGAQMTATPTKDITVVVQLVSEQNWDNSWRPKVEWANVKYAFSPDLSVRLGRILLPTYMLSESRKVGYTNLWVRPPVDLYNLLGVTNNDGVDVTYRQRMGDVSNTVSAFYGKTKVTIAGGSEAKLTHVQGISDAIEYGDWNARVSYLEMKMAMPALAPFNSFGCAGCDTNVPLSVTDVGFTYDPGTWLLSGEWARSKLSKGSFHIGGVKTAAYVSAGYRVEKFTPYLVYSQMRHRLADARRRQSAKNRVRRRALGLLPHRRPQAAV